MFDSQLLFALEEIHQILCHEGVLYMNCNKCMSIANHALMARSLYMSVFVRGV